MIDAHAHLASASDPRASGPRPGRRDAPRAYLDLLKLCLCDLEPARARRRSGAMADGGTVMSPRAARRLLRLRAAGKWTGLAVTHMIVLNLPRDPPIVRGVVVVRWRGREIDESRPWRAGRRSSSQRTLGRALRRKRSVWAPIFLREDFSEADAPDDGRSTCATSISRQTLDDLRASFARRARERWFRFRAGRLSARRLPPLAARSWAIVPP